MTPLAVRTVRNVVIASIAITALHYIDNAIYIDEYPAPDWIHRETVFLAWSLFTFIGVAGYFFYRDGRPGPAAAYLFVYSYTGLSSLLHYLHGASDEFTPKMHAFIWTDGLVGAAVLYCAIRILLAGRTASRV